MTQAENETQCVYTIVNTSVIEHAKENGGQGEFEENSRWTAAAKHFESLGEDEVYLLLLANAANITGVQWLAGIENIELLEHGTKVKFSELIELPFLIPLNALRKKSDSQPLSLSYIRPYVPCFIEGETDDAVWAAIDEALGDEVNPALAEIDSKTTQDYVKAIAAIENKITAKQRAMLIGHAQAPGHVLSMRALAAIAGYPSHGTANIQYGTLGRKFANFFNVSGLQNQTQAMAWSQGEPDETGHFAWTLRQPLVDALSQLGWVPKAVVTDFESEVAAREVDADPNCKGLPATVRQALIEARVGQGAYRDRLLQIWGAKCALTGCDLKDVLIASHAKPWAESDNKERLDEYNGLLLAAHADKLFDAGLISFADDGALLVRTNVKDEALATLGIHRTMRLSSVSQRHLPYLKAHRVKFGFTTQPLLDTIREKMG